MKVKDCLIGTGRHLFMAKLMHLAYVRGMEHFPVATYNAIPNFLAKLGRASLRLSNIIKNLNYS